MTKRQDRENSHTVHTDGGTYVAGDVHVDGDFVGRDSIVTNIQNIYQRALTAAEEAKQAQAIEVEYLARGVGAYVERLQALASEVDDTGGPYKGLLEYRLSDAEIFLGRERDTREVLQRLDRHPLTVLHSESGAGKTSLLEAGVSPHLIAGGHLPVYRRPYDVAPTMAIKQAFLPNLSAAPGLAAASLRDFLWQVCNVLGPHTTLYVFVDQFEEFFTHLDQEARAGFVRELAECLDDETLNVRWVLALRTEFFGSLATFRPRIRNPFENDYRLGRLTRDQAQAVITQPAERCGISFEAGVVDTLLDDLGQTEIAPPQIQLVCSALYGELGDGKAITRALYDREGGAAGILRGHLERVLNRDVPAPQRTTARRLLEALISSELRRVIRTHAGLATELASQGIAPEVLDATLAQLVDSRLLRVYGERAEGGELSYELAHDYLLDEIKLDPAVQARKAAQELLDREVESYVRHGTLLSQDKWAIVEPRRGELVLSDPATTLLDQSERAIKRRQRVVLGGVGLVVALVIVGAISVFAAIGAQRAARTAQDLQVTSEAGVATASAREASANASASDAATREAIAATNEAAAVTREAVANQALREAFWQTGVVPVGDGPSALAFDAARSRLWVANSSDDTVQAIDSTTGEIVQTIQVGRHPNKLLFDAPRGRLWVINADDATVQAIDPATGSVSEPIQVTGSPLGMVLSETHLWITADSALELILHKIDPDAGTVEATIQVGSICWPFILNSLAFDGARLWVVSDCGVRAIDPETLAVGEAIYVGGSDPLAQAVIFDGTRVLVIHFGQIDIGYGIMILDPVTTNVEKYVDVTYSSEISSLSAVAFDGTLVWAAESGGVVRAVDPATNFVAPPIAVGRHPTAMAVDGQHVWVADWDYDTVRRIDVGAGLPFAPVAVGNLPSALALDGERLWIANAGNDAVRALDLDTGDLGEPIPVGSSPIALAFGGNHLWVANLVDGTVQAIDLATGAVTMTTEVGANPRALVFDGKRLWVANEADGSVQAVDPDTGVAGAPILLDDNPIALATDGTTLWVAGKKAVWTVDTKTGSVLDLQDSPFVTALAFDGKHLWGAFDSPPPKLSTLETIVVDPTDEHLSIEIGDGDTVSTALIYDGVRLWVANTSDNTVQAVYPPGKVDAPIPVGEAPAALAFDGQRLWVANSQSGTVQYVFIIEQSITE